LRDLDFGGDAFFVGTTLAFAGLLFERVVEVPLDLAFGEAAFFVDSTSAFAPSFFVLLEEVDLVLAETAFLLAAICDLKSFTADSALSSFLRVFDSCAFSFFFFIFS